MKMKILIAGVIAVAFLLTVPFVGGDVDKESASAEVDPSDVASIGDTGYATLESAIGSSNANDTITLLNDYTTISKITIDKDLTIDLNDKTLTLGYALELTDGTVVIKDGSIASSLLTAVTVTGESELTSENVVVSVEFEAYRVSGSTDISSPTYGYEPSLTIIGGSVTSAKDCCVFIYGISSLEIEGDASLESRGMYATIQGNGNATSGGTTVKLGACSVINTYVVEQGEPSVSAIYVPQAVTFDIDGATIEGGTGLYIKSGTYTIKNASITGTAHHRGYEYYNNGANGTGDAIVIDTCGYPGGNPAVSIQSGTYSSVYASSVGSYAYGDGNSILTGFITGGTFDDFSAIPYMEDGSSIDIVLSETITLISSIINIDGDKTVNIDLNGNNIEFADGKRFLICNGTLNLTGEGTVRESVPDYSPIMLKGAVGAPSGYSEVSIGADVTVEGWAAVFIDKVSGVDVGSKATIAGTLIGKNDKGNYTGAGVYVNGTVDGAEIIVTGTADISGTGHGMYLAGNADTTIADGAVITGEMTGIEIRAGSLTVNGGTIEGKGTPTEFLSNGNGSTTTGAGIAVVKHTTTFDLSATITAGEIIGYTALYERKDANAGAGTITLRVTGGSFVSGGGDAVYSENCTAFITGGNFDDKPDSSYYVKYSVSAPSDGTGYTVSPGKSPVISGRSYTFTVTVLSGYTGTVSVTADGTHGKITTYVRDDVTTVTIPDIRSVIKSIKVSGISAETVIITDPETGTVTETTTNTEGTTTQETSTSTNTEGDTSVKTTIIDTATGVATTAVKSDTETKVETTVNTEATVSDDTAVATVTETAIAEALDQVDKATDTIDADDVVPVIEIIATASGDPTDIKDSIVEVAADSLKAIADAGAEVKITTATGEIVLDKDAVSNIADKEGDKVEISIGKASSEDLNEKQRERVGNETVFTLSAKVGTESVHELGGKATITVDYTPLPGEDMSKKTIFYIDDEGEIYVRATVYKDGKLTFETATFSLYFLGEKSTSDAGADNTMLYVGIVIVAIVIVAIAAGVMLKRKGVL